MPSNEEKIEAVEVLLEADDLPLFVQDRLKEYLRELREENEVLLPWGAAMAAEFERADIFANENFGYENLGRIFVAVLKSRGMIAIPEPADEDE